MTAESASRVFWNGIRDVFPLLVGVAPFAAVVEVMTRTLGISETSVVAMAASSTLALPSSPASSCSTTARP